MLRRIVHQSEPLKITIFNSFAFTVKLQDSLTVGESLQLTIASKDAVIIFALMIFGQ